MELSHLALVVGYALLWALHSIHLNILQSFSFLKLEGVAAESGRIVLLSTVELLVLTLAWLVSLFNLNLLFIFSIHQICITMTLAMRASVSKSSFNFPVYVYQLIVEKYSGLIFFSVEDWKYTNMIPLGMYQDCLGGRGGGERGMEERERWKRV